MNREERKVYWRLFLILLTLLLLIWWWTEAIKPEPRPVFIKWTPEQRLKIKAIWKKHGTGTIYQDLETGKVWMIQGKRRIDLYI